MRVLVINYEFPPVGGGGGRVSLDVSRELAARGHAVAVLTSHANGLPHQEEVDGIDVQRIRCFRRHRDRCTVPEMGAFIVAAIPAALALTKKFRPDVIHAHFAVPTGAVAFVVNTVTGTPYVLTAHLGDVPGGVPEQTDQLFRLINPFVRPIWKRAARTTAVSSFVAALAQKAYGRPIDVVNNGVALQSGPMHDVGSTTRIVFVGRFNPQKNLPFLIDTLAAVADLPWQAELVGNGPDFAKVEERISRAGLNDRIVLSGWRDDSEVDGFLSRSDILALPSLSEGFPVVAARALGHGLALFASDIPGLADLVDDGINGTVIQPKNLSHSVAGLRSMLSDPNKLRRMREASRLRAERFEIGQVVNRYEQILTTAAR